MGGGGWTPWRKLGEFSRHLLLFAVMWGCLCAANVITFLLAQDTTTCNHIGWFVVTECAANGFLCVLGLLGAVLDSSCTCCATNPADGRAFQPRAAFRLKDERLERTHQRVDALLVLLTLLSTMHAIWAVGGVVWLTTSAARVDCQDATSAPVWRVTVATVVTVLLILTPLVTWMGMHSRPCLRMGERTQCVCFCCNFCGCCDSSNVLAMESRPPPCTCECFVRRRKAVLPINAPMDTKRVAANGH